MKKINFLILSFATMFSIRTYAQQVNCGTTPTAETLQEIDQMLGSQTGCSDDLSVYNLDEPITFNLVLNYAKEGSSQGAFDQNDRNLIENDISNVFAPQNIFFNITWNNLDCDNCLINEDQWPEYMETNTCIQGHVLSSYIPNNLGVGGLAAGIGAGKFWGYPYAIPHELGHAIGLLHTHSNDESTTGYTDELVNRSSSDPCGCNCLELGDRICDTPSDPNIGFPENSAEIAHNQAMFSNCMLVNNNNILDDCGNPYSDPNQIITNNVMSYHCDNQNLPRMTQGQNHRIRMMMSTDNGSFKYEYDQNEMPFSSGEIISAPTTKNTDQAFNGDLVVNSDLIIENCIIELTEGHKIMVGHNGNLTIKNAEIRTYTGGICYFPMEDKEYWEGIEILPGSSDFTRVSILDKSIINLSESGIFNPAGTTGLAKVNVYNSTIDGPSIHLSNISGTSRLKDSDFNNTVKFTNVTSLRVLGCNFDFPIGSETSGIKALDTRLYLQKYYDGSGTFSNNSFTNCGKAIEFVSSSSHSCIISNSDFTDVLTGISAKNVGGFMKVNNCDVNLRNPSGTIGFGDGILVDNFIDFAIYDNEITGSGSASQKGIEILHTGLNDNPNLLINNTISECFKGISSVQAELGNILSGVEFECNTMINIANDNFHTSKIGPHQGRATTSEEIGRPAGNKFDGSTIGFQDFNYEGGGFTDIKTYHYRDVGNENIQNYNDGSQVTGVPVFTIDRLTGGETPQCAYPIKGNNPIPLPDLPTSHTDYTSMFDGGSTDDNINLVFTDSNSDPNGVLTEILDDSPWVSIPVAQALLANSQYYTEGQIAQVIIQNPGVLDDNFISEIVFSTNSFSASNQQLMLQSYQNGDTRMLHEQSLLDIIYEGTLHIKDEITDQVINDNFDEITIRNQISSKFSKTKLYQTIESYVKEGDYANAISTLNSKVDAQTYDPLLLNESLVYGEILTIGASLYNGGDSWVKISNTDQTRLIAIANSYNGLATKKARNILEAYHDMVFGGMPQRPSYSPLSFLGASPRSENTSGIIEVFPNPTNGVLNITVLSGEDQYTMDIMSLDGRIIKTFDVIGDTKINVSDISKGVYIYSISNASGLFATDKIIILE